MTLDDLLRLPGASLSAVVEATGADPTNREPVTGYESIKKVDVIEAPGGARIFVRGDDVVLVYFGDGALPQGVDHGTLTAAVGSDGEGLRSRQGKTAVLHVVAEKGIAWSQDGRETGFVEIFPPCTDKAYRKDIYRKPPKFTR